MGDLPRATWSFPTTVRFGPGVLDELPSLLAGLSVARPLLVTDHDVARLPIFERLQATLREGGLAFEVYAGVRPSPAPRHITDGVAAYREGLCDGVVGFGGGSALDAAKGVALLVHHPLDIFAYADAEGRRGIQPDLMPPLVAIPTTAGTGSEVGRSTVITDPGAGRKRMIAAPALMPRLALLDPELTRDLPPAIAAATGMDALTHCVESYLSPVFHPLCDAIALGGIERVARALERAVTRGADDAEARADMMIAAAMGAVAFQKDLGATHALAHPLSIVADVPHGTANGMLLARVMRYNLEAATDRIAAVGRALMAGGLAAGAPGGARAEAEAACEVVEGLARRVGMPARLREVGVREDQLALLAQKALEDPCHRTNPRPCGLGDLLALYREAY